MTLHTQREEDIKEFEDRFVCHCEHVCGELNKEKSTDDVKDFISNIYIKIAENNIKRLDSKRGSLDTRYNSAILDEVVHWQEELNKLKA